jgi:hypothetical protein
VLQRTTIVPVPHDELVIAATFDPPDAQARYERWRETNTKLLGELPADAVRVDTGRAISGGTFVRVWLPRSALTALHSE